MTPSISVAVAARNYGQYLSQTLDSVRSQTWTDWECVIIDDGSTDNTPEVIQPYLSDRRFRYHRTEGLGQSRAKNLGWKLARAPLIAFLDADDLWLPTKLERQYRLFRAKPALGMVHGLRTFIGPKGELLTRPCPPPVRGMVLDRMIVQNTVCFSSVMVRRDVLEHLGGFDVGLDLAIDFDLWLRLTHCYPIDYINEVLVRYRTGHANLSQRTNERIRLSLSIKRRFLYRRGHVESVSPQATEEAWASTWRTAGFLRRSGSVAGALACYFRALRHSHDRLETMRSIGVALAHGAIRLVGHRTR